MEKWTKVKKWDLSSWLMWSWYLLQHGWWWIFRDSDASLDPQRHVTIPLVKNYASNDNLFTCTHSLFALMWSRQSSTPQVWPTQTCESFFTVQGPCDQEGRKSSCSFSKNRARRRENKLPDKEVFCRPSAHLINIWRLIGKVASTAWGSQIRPHVLIFKRCWTQRHAIGYSFITVLQSGGFYSLQWEKKTQA